MDERITFDDLKAMDCDWISATMAASALRMNPGRLIQYAKEGRTPFACRISGNRVLVNRKSLLKEYGQLEDEKQEKADHQLIADKLDKILTALTATNILLLNLTHAMDPETFGTMDKFMKEAGLQ